MANEAPLLFFIFNKKLTAFILFVIERILLKSNERFKYNLFSIKGMYQKKSNLLYRVGTAAFLVGAVGLASLLGCDKKQPATPNTSQKPTSSQPESLENKLNQNTPENTLKAFRHYFAQKDFQAMYNLCSSDYEDKLKRFEHNMKGLNSLGQWEITQRTANKVVGYLHFDYFDQSYDPVKKRVFKDPNKVVKKKEDFVLEKRKGKWVVTQFD